MKKITQQKIIETAVLLIGQTQNTEVTLSQIADELGITHAALYKHFKNKQDLWEAVAKCWFNNQILGKINLKPEDYASLPEFLHAWLWAFANAKKKAYNEDQRMFALNTQYVDNHPFVLRNVLTEACKTIDQFMNYHDPNYERAEAIFSTFSVFNLPMFSQTWNLPNYQERFETIWDLIKSGI
jgi:AcrR family transcriptional regulator